MADPFTVSSAKFVGKSGNDGSEVFAYSPSRVLSPCATKAVSDDGRPLGAT